MLDNQENSGVEDKSEQIKEGEDQENQSKETDSYQESKKAENVRLKAELSKMKSLLESKEAEEQRAKELALKEQKEFELLAELKTKELEDMRTKLQNEENSKREFMIQSKIREELNRAGLKINGKLKDRFVEVIYSDESNNIVITDSNDIDGVSEAVESFKKDYPSQFQTEEKKVPVGQNLMNTGSNQNTGARHTVASVGLTNDYQSSIMDSLKNAPKLN